mmetsp:Transcript_55135/g.124112  ORF Transcript_55135/g.124112 Transcript_55135/m.124112 type:complete len:215 (+) Transcript_55135:393-1037(+)
MASTSSGRGGHPFAACSEMASRQDCLSGREMMAMSSGLLFIPISLLGSCSVLLSGPSDVQTSTEEPPPSRSTTATQRPLSEMATGPARSASFVSQAICEHAAVRRQQRTFPLQRRHTSTRGAFEVEHSTTGGKFRPLTVSDSAMLSFSGSSSWSWPVGHTITRFCTVDTPWVLVTSMKTAIVPNSGLTAMDRTTEFTRSCVSCCLQMIRLWTRL